MALEHAGQRRALQLVTRHLILVTAFATEVAGVCAARPISCD
jgi:hypothetical protein